MWCREIGFFLNKKPQT